MIDSFDSAFAVSPSDTVDFTYVTRALYVGGAGQVSAVTANGETVLFSGMLAGTIYPLKLRRINLNGTTATVLLGLL